VTGVKDRSANHSEAVYRKKNKGKKNRAGGKKKTKLDLTRERNARSIVGRKPLGGGGSGIPNQRGLTGNLGPGKHKKNFKPAADIGKKKKKKGKANTGL